MLFLGVKLKFFAPPKTQYSKLLLRSAVSPSDQLTHSFFYAELSFFDESSEVHSISKEEQVSALHIRTTQTRPISSNLAPLHKQVL